MREKISVTIDSHIVEYVKLIANLESRSVSNEMETLLKKALGMRDLERRPKVNDAA